MKGVEKSEANMAMVSAWGLSLDQSFLRSKLIVIAGNAMSVPVCLGVSEGSDPLLVSVLDKAILKIDHRKLEGSVFNSILSVKEEVTLMSLIEKYPFYAAAVLFFFLFAVVFFIYRSRANRKQRSILKEKNRELEEAVTVQEQLRIAAQTDCLTGLKNKSNGEYACQQYLRQFPNENHALLILDVDNFKKINDTYGHLFGDEMLKQFGQLLMAVVGQKDIVARIGGDEFLIFMTGIQSKQQVVEQVERLYEKSRASMDSTVSCSAGIVISQSSPHKRYDELFFEADQALYEAKRRGKNQYVFHQEK